MARSHRRRRSVLRAGVAALPLLVLFLLVPATALAHPLDQVVEATYLTVQDGTVEVELKLSPGSLVVDPVITALDADGDGTISDSEGDGYARSLLPAVTLTLDGEPLALRSAGVEVPTVLALRAGYGEVVIHALAVLPARTAGDTATLAITNADTTGGGVFQVNAFVERGAAADLGTQIRSDDQRTLQVSVTFGATAGAGTAGGTAATAATAGGTASEPSAAGQLAAFVEDADLSPAGMLLAALVAATLGALHALTPGHGKTLVAAYLVGTRGTVRHAVALGGIVTVTHTSSVIAVGILALAASSLIVPSVLAPALEILSGLLVVMLGARLLAGRWRAVRPHRATTSASPAHAHGHGHDVRHDPADAEAPPHPHSHDGSFAGLVHDHGDGRPHAHALRDGAPGARGLLAMGITAGLLPCPEALGVMIVAVGLGRIVLGLGLIVAFSAGLAGVLMGLGIVLVRSRGVLGRVTPRDPRWTTAVPLVSAVVVTALGAGILLGGLRTVLTA
ncbi:MAG: hypothetical protein U0869_00865 [Chloroflexota bacterium]